MATDNAAAALHDLSRRIEAIGSALVGRDGNVLYADLPTGTYADTFAIMCATIVGAAVTAASELDRASPTEFVVEGPDATMLIVGSGPRALLVAMLPAGRDVAAARSEMTKFADLLRPA